MKKKILIFLSLVISFGFGFALKGIITKQPRNNSIKTISTKQLNGGRKMKKVTGIGGIFFKCKEPNKLKEWYKKHLGLDTDEYGTNFEWRQGADAAKKGFTQWSPFVETTKYFEPSTNDFMINYRVENLEALVEQLKKEGVVITDKIKTYE